MAHYNLTAAIILGIAMLQGLLLIVALVFNKKGARRANIFLIAAITAITLIIFQNFVILSGEHIRFPHISGLFYSLNGLIAPFFLMYVLFVLYPNRGFKAYDLLHLAGFFYKLCFSFDYLLSSAEEKFRITEYFYFGNVLFDSDHYFPLLLDRLVVFCYSLVAVYLIKSKIKGLKVCCSNTNIQYLNRFLIVSYLFIGYTVSFMLIMTYVYVFEKSFGLYEIYHHAVNSLTLVLMAIVAMQQPDRLVFLLQEKADVSNLKTTVFSSLDALKELMNETKPFLNPDLTLNDLAVLVGIPPHVLSGQINKHLEMNFYEFINGYRVEEFKLRATSSEYSHYNFLAIAYDVGFNSKASFNRIFKKHTGKTPSQYLAQSLVSTSEVESNLA